MTTYWLHTSGGVSKLDNIPGPPDASGDWTETTQVGYEANLAVFQAAREAEHTARKVAACEVAHSVYVELVTLGLSPEAAKALTGWGGGSC